MLDTPRNAKGKTQARVKATEQMAQGPQQMHCKRKERHV